MALGSSIELVGLFTEIGRLGGFFAGIEPGGQLTRHIDLLSGAGDSHIE
jgi:hypothetical protein